MKAKIVTLPGDGIGPEIMAQAVKTLTSVACAFGHSFTLLERKLGGASIDAFGEPLTPGVLKECQGADAVLLGAVGGPQWDGLAAERRPEKGLLALRSGLEVFANLRPLKVYEALADASPLKKELLRDVDVLMVRELTGDVYFGEHRWEGDWAGDEMTYTRREIERAAHLAFRLAQGRRNRLCSVDKANVLAVSRLWRDTVDRVAGQYPSVAVTHLYVDNCAMQLAREPARFDVIFTGNLFGDILSDEAAAVAGTLGVMPSASLGAGSLGLYEPIHGSAPDIAGRDMANPLGMILSCALLLRCSLGLEREAACVEAACRNVIEAGWRTPDMAAPGYPSIGTQGMGELVCEQIELAGEIMG